MNRVKDKVAVITEVFEAICCFIDHYENEWPAVIDDGSVHMIFQQTLFLETAYQQMEAHDSTTDELSMLFKAWLLRNKTINPWYKLSFFKTSSDRMLERFIRDKNMSEFLVQKAKEEYISVCSQERFYVLSKKIKDADKTMTSLLRIQANINGSKNVKKAHLDNSLFLFEEMLYLRENGNHAKLYEKVATMMRRCDMVEFLLRILTPNVTTNDAQEKQTNTKELVLEAMLKNLCKHNKIRSKFWRSCCKINQNLLSDVVSIHFSFLVAMRDYIQRSGDALKLKVSYIENDEGGSFLPKWENPENYLSYDELALLIKSLLSSNRKPEKTIKTLLINNAKLRNKDPNVWTELSLFFQVTDLDNTIN